MRRPPRPPLTLRRPVCAAAHGACGLPTSAGGRLVETCTPSDWATPLAPAPPPRGPPAVALGKFDALHRGHARLATTAAAAPALHTPWLVSFSGMAAELGWAPRRPLVSPDDRGRVLASWAAACGGAAPRQRVVPFAQVRTLSPADFVDALCGSLGAAHVVVGEGYRFGHRAAGDTRALIDLCAARGVGVTVVPLVPAGGGETTPVSSSGVRAALAAGRLAEVEAALGRRYRLVAHVPPGDAPPPGGRRLSIPLPCFQNELPRAQQYAASVSVAPLGGSPAAVIDLRRADVTISSDCVDVDLPPGVAVPAVGGDAGVRVVFDF